MTTESLLEQDYSVILLRDSSLELSVAHDAAEQIAQRLRSLSSSAGPSDADTYFYTRVRVKARNSIVEKVMRQQSKKGDPYYSFRDMTDLVGVRIVTLFDDQLKLAIASVLKIIEAGQRLSQPLFEPNFLWNSFYDARFVCRSADKQDIYRECHGIFLERIETDYKHESSKRAQFREDEIKKRAPCQDPNQEKYSSAHMTFLGMAHLKGAVVLIPIEFQVRAVSEDIWSEINHKFLYKLRSYYAWHPVFSSDYATAAKKSVALKGATDSLSNLVAEFREAAKDTSKDLMIFKNPKTGYHFSFCISIFDELGNTFTDHFIENILEHKKAIDKLNSLEIIRSSRQAAQVILKSIEEMQTIQKRINAQIKQIEKDGDGSELAKSTIYQKMHMIEFEIARLKTVMYLYTEYRIDTGGSVKKIGGAEESIHIFTTLYADICNIKNSETLLVHPAAVFYFWKYLVSQNFDSFVASENLMYANEHIDDDATLPKWSIYHVLIPNRLASEKFTQAIEIEEVRQAIVTKGSLAGLDNEIRMKLTDALRLAIKAFNRHKDYDPKRGDLIFRSEQHANPLGEGALVLEIVKFHSEVFKSNVDDIAKHKRYAGQPIATLLYIVGEVDSSLKQGWPKTVEKHEEYSRLVNDVKNILMPTAGNAA